MVRAETSSSAAAQPEEDEDGEPARRSADRIAARLLLDPLIADPLRAREPALLVEQEDQALEIDTHTWRPDQVD